MPAAQQLTHLEFVEAWDNLPALLSACSSTLRSLSVPYPGPDSPLLHELLQLTPKLQSFTLTGDPSDTEIEQNCAQDAMALASLQHLTHLAFKSQVCLPLLTTPLPENRCQVQEVKVMSPVTVSELDQLLSSKCLAPNAHIMLHRLELDSAGDAAADAQLYARLAGALRGRRISTCADEPYDLTLYPDVVYVQVPDADQLDSPELQQRLVMVLGALPGVRLPEGLMEQLCKEMEGISRHFSSRLAWVTAWTGEESHHLAGRLAADHAAAAAAAGVIWLLPAMHGITTVVLDDIEEASRSSFFLLLPAVQAAGLLPRLRQTIFAGYVYTAAAEMAHALAACPHLAIVPCPALRPSHVGYAYSAGAAQQFGLSPEALRVLRQRLLH